MARASIDRLKAKYDVSRMNFGDIVGQILESTTMEISGDALNITRENWAGILKKVQPGKKAPDVKRVLRESENYFKKVRLRGRPLVKTLRDRLVDKLKKRLEQFKIEQPDIDRARITREHVKRFTRDVKQTFRDYTKIDPKIGRPPNIDTIATTEFRAAVNGMKQNYIRDIMHDNPGMKVMKTWIHNPALSKNPRIGHKRGTGVHGTTLPHDGMFKVPFYITVGGHDMIAGHDMMNRPHDENAPARQVINCACEIVYSVE